MTLLVNAGSGIEKISEEMEEKLLNYVKETKLKETCSLVIGTTLSNAIDEVPSKVWIELFNSMDYTWLEEQTAIDLFIKYNEEEIDQLIEWQKDPLFEKVMKNMSSGIEESQQRAAKWMAMVHKDLLINIVTCFEKHNIDEKTIKDVLEFMGSCDDQ